MNDDWASFYQKEELTTRLHNILDEYPPGLGPFKEFLQNADDAGARKFALVYDAGSYGRDTLLTEQLADWQGPALLVYNSAVFSDRDFDNITSLGASNKVEDRSKIGKYGLGFNISYHFTDIVSFVSRDQVVFFDPHGTSLPGEKPGIKTNFVEKRLGEAFPDQFAPYEDVGSIFGCTMRDTFNGTLFRLPLRSGEVAAKSKISSMVYSHGEVKKILKQFGEAAGSMMLFLKNVEEITIYIKEAGTAMPVLMHRSYVKGPTEDVRFARSLLTHQGQEGAPERMSFKLELVTEVTGKDAVSEAYFLRCGAGTATAEECRRIGQFDWAGVALRLDGQEAVAGKAYCFLPLPVSTGLPVHINGTFALTSNRRDLWRSESDVEGSSTAKHAWNVHLLTSTLPSLYAELLDGVVDLAAPPEAQEVIFRSFPPDTSPFEAFRSLCTAAAADIASNARKLFFERREHLWCNLTQVVFEDDVLAGGEFPRLRALVASLRDGGGFLVQAPAAVRASLRAVAPAAVRECSPQMVAGLLRGKKHVKYDDCEEVLSYLLFKWSPGKKDVFALLDGLKLLPLEGNAVGTFAINAEFIRMLEPAAPMKAAVGSDEALEVHGKKKKKGKKGKPGARSTKPPSTTTTSASLAGMAVDVEEYYTCPKTYFALMAGRPIIVSHATRCYAALASADCYDVANISPLTPGVLATEMGNVVPAEWKSWPCVLLTDKPTGGTARDLRGGKDDTADATAAEGGKPDATGRKGKKDKKQGRKETRKQEPPQVPVVSAADAPALRERLDLLFAFLDHHETTAAHVLGLFADWPIVPTAEGFCLSPPYALRRVLLEEDAFKPSEVTILRRVGCLFSPPSTGSLLSRGSTLSFSKASHSAAFAAVAASVDGVFHTCPRDVGAGLRQLVSDWTRDGSVDLPPEVMRGLPIFETFDGSFVALPRGESPYAVAPPSPGKSSYDAESWFDDAFAPLFPANLVRVEPRLFQDAAFARPPVDVFLNTFLAPRMAVVAQEAPADVLARILSLVGADETSPMMAAIRTLGVVVLPDGQRKPCSAFIDPEEPFLLETYDGTCMLPPPDYSTPSVLVAMRAAGMLSLRDFPCFLAVAQSVEQNNLVDAGRHLVHFLIHNHKYLSWRSADWNRVAVVRFVPGYDFRQSFLPPAVCPLPKGTVCQQKQKKNKNVLAWDDLDLYGEDPSMVGDLSGLRKIAENMIASGPPRQKGCIDTALVAPSTSSTLRHAWHCWKTHTLLPAAFSSAPAGLLSCLAVRSRV